MLYQIIRVIFTTGCAKSLWPHSSHKEKAWNLNLSKTKTFLAPTFLKGKQCPHNVEAFFKMEYSPAPEIIVNTIPSIYFYICSVSS